MNKIRLQHDLLRDEGFRSKPYKDTVGKLTIGVGRNLDDVGISETEAMALLQNDIDKVEKTLTAYIPEYSQLDEVRQRVLANMCFNVGFVKLMEFKKMWIAIRARDYDAASKEMLDSTWAKQVGVRAERLSEMMRKGE